MAAYNAYNMKEHILEEDKELLVCYKPAGMPVQSAGLGRMDMESSLKNYLVRKNPGKMPYLGVIHRLDQPVEGILVFAGTKTAAAELNRQSQQGKMKKKYLAVVHGVPREPEGVLEDYLLKDGRTNRSKAVAKGTPGSKNARLSYRTIETIKAEGEEPLTLVEVTLDTGRHHQIRVQMSHHGIPLAGDHKYGREDGISQVALCAYCLEFVHPKKGKKLKYQIRPEGEIFKGFSCLEE